MDSIGTRIEDRQKIVKRLRIVKGLSGNQISVPQPLFGHSGYNVTHLFDCVFRSHVVPSRKLIDASAQVFDGHFVIDPTSQYRVR